MISKATSVYIIMLVAFGAEVITRDLDLLVDAQTRLGIDEQIRGDSKQAKGEQQEGKLPQLRKA